jgi:tetratricopeptide (TPR) repeat protein
MHDILGRFGRISKNASLSQKNYQNAGVNRQNLDSLRPPVSVSLLTRRLEKLDSLIAEAKRDRSQNRLFESEAKFRKIIDSYQRLVSPAHPRVGALLNELALTLVRQKKYAEAELAFKSALNLIEKSLPEAHPGRIICLKNYAVLLERTNRQAMADKLRKLVSILMAV